MPKCVKQEIVNDDGKFKWFVVEKLINVESRISKLEVKAGVWGMLGGVAVLALAIGLDYYKKAK